MAPPVFYYDGMSQPCRAVLNLIKLNNLDVELKYVSIAKGEQRSEEFKAINPLCKLPYFVDDGLQIQDSMAILIYLCRKYNLPSNWYPSELGAQSHVNSVLGWHGSTLRTGSTQTIVHRAFMPFRGAPTDDTIPKAFSLNVLRTALGTINDVWLADSDYVAGNDVSIADLQLACEVDMLRLMDGAPLGPSFDELLEPVPKVAAWLSRVQERCAPVYAETNATLLKTRDVFVKAMNAAKM